MAVINMGSKDSILGENWNPKSHKNFTLLQKLDFQNFHDFFIPDFIFYLQRSFLIAIKKSSFKSKHHIYTNYLNQRTKNKLNSNLMNTNLTEIAFILDRSGSMSSLVQETLAGFNAFLRDQQALPGLARLSLVLFDDRYEVPIKSQPVAEIPLLDERVYTTRGSTALLDAIARTIDDLGARLADTPESERPGKVIIAILTDGQENASQHFNIKDVNKRISHQQEKYAWDFLFLGANQDAISTGAQMGIFASNSATFSASSEGTLASHSSLSRKAKAMRMQSMKMADEECVKDLAMSASEILREEEEKMRKAKERRARDGK